MTGTERKRQWRITHPEESREAERLRAQARRNGYWSEPVLGEAPRPCVSAESYARYEYTTKRFLQRMNWPRLGPGTTRMSLEERRAGYQRFFDDARRALEETFDNDPDIASWVKEMFPTLTFQVSRPTSLAERRGVQNE